MHLGNCSGHRNCHRNCTAAAPDLAGLPMSELARRRARIAADLEAAEARWLEASEQLDQAAA